MIRGMRRCLLIALSLMALLAAPNNGRAMDSESSAAIADAALDQVLQTVDTGEWQALADSAGVDISLAGVLSNLAHGRPAWDGAALISALLKLFSNRLMGGVGIATLAAPALLYALIGQLRRSGGDTMAQVGGYACYLLAATALMAQFASKVGVAKLAIDRMGQASGAIFPVLMTMLAVTGNTAAASVMQPAVVSSSGVLSTIVRTVAMGLTSCAAVLAVLSHLTERISLSGLFNLSRSACNWLLGITMTAFLGVMSVQGALAGAYDGVSIRTARYAVDNLVPIVGGEVADTMDVLVKSALLVKGAAGVTGMALLVGVCLMPLVDLVIAILGLKVVSALMEPVADGPVVSLIAAFSKVMTMLLVAVVSSAVMLMVMIGAVLAAGGAAAMMR